jgi:heme-based aerotactic transducer
MPVSADLQKRLDLLMINNDTKHNLNKLLPVFKEDLDDIVRRFYAHIMSFPDVEKILKSEDRIAPLKEKQKKHWISLFSCRFDNKYVESAVRVGQIHFKHGIAPHLYIAGYNFFHCALIQAVAQRHASAYELTNLCASVTRVISLDMDLSLSVYTREYWRQKSAGNAPNWLID